MHDVHAPDEEGFIPFIHNYCDRWCEQCRFVARCRVGIEELDAEEGGFKQRTPEEAMKETKENMLKTIEMLRKMAEEQGVDLNEALADTPENNERDQRMEKRRANAREHPLSLRAREYAVEQHHWMVAHRERIKQLMTDMAHQAELGIDPEGQLERATGASAALELIERYAMLIGSKSARAVMGKKEAPDPYEEDLGPHQTDWNGSAKVTLMLVGSSIGAWHMVLEVMPALADDALPLLASLKKCNAMLEKEFPEAGEFVRPGFDAPAVGDHGGQS